MSILNLIYILTFPGVIIHEFAHQIFCYFSNVKVHKVCYFRFGNPAGYVVHEVPNSYIKMLLIDVGPLFVNTLISMIAFYFVILEFNLILIWLGFSIGAHSFPSSGDADALWKYTKRFIRKNPLILFGIPIILLIRVVNELRIFYLDLAYPIFLFFIVASYII